MRKYLILVIFILFTACSPSVILQDTANTPTAELQPTDIPHTPTLPAATLPAETPSPEPVEIPAMFVPIRDEIARSLDVPADQVVLVSAQDVEWGNSCLGIEQPGMACMDVITPGFLVVFDTPLGKVEAHTNADASSFQIVPSKSGAGG